MNRKSLTSPSKYTLKCIADCFKGDLFIAFNNSENILAFARHIMNKTCEAFKRIVCNNMLWWQLT